MGFSFIGWPESFDVRCPSCGGHAVFDEPFSFLSGSGKEPPPHNLPVHEWGGWRVVEKYPGLLPWKAPHGSHQSIVFSAPRARNGEYVYHHTGVVRCGDCFWSGVHELNWPEDAYFRWEVRGQILWAWSAEHARALLDYIGSKHRDASGSPYVQNLMRLPKEFLEAKAREHIVKRIGATLAASKR